MGLIYNRATDRSDLVLLDGQTLEPSRPCIFRRACHTVFTETGYRVRTSIAP